VNLFICLLDPEGQGISDRVRQSYESLPRSRGLSFQWHKGDQLAVLVGTDDTDHGSPMVAREGDCIGVGIVRLDNRGDCERWAGCSRHGLTDLELVLRVVSRHGTDYVPQFLGDFAFVVWDAINRAAIAACDTFAVRKLYFVERNGLVAFASRAEALARGEQYDVQYLAERVATCIPTPDLTPYIGVKAVPGSRLAVLRGGKLTTREYWSPHAFISKPAWVKSEQEAAATCRALLAQAVQLRLGANEDTWAQLSGGMDSSSVVSMAQWLAAKAAVAHGLAGTVTFVDTHGTGADERDFSGAVVSRWQLRNEPIVDPPVWHDDQFPPPRTDEPSVALIVYPRTCRLCAIVRTAGAKVLLTGVGGDELFSGNMFFFADWMARGQVGLAVREMARRAAIGRVSFWELAYRNALLPLTPRPVQRRLVRDVGQMPPWVARPLVERYGLHARALAPTAYAGPLGNKYFGALATGVDAIRSGLLVGVIEDTLDVRHPFLHRPLVEFALTLPPELCARPQARKWVLRQAMRGILPELVRQRIGKGVLVGCFAWSAAHQQKLLEPLARESILAALGIIDSREWSAAFSAAQNEQANRERLSGAVQTTLAIEAWLQMRTGRWPRGATPAA
jgi:asparagine synthase (glutamine-hydrolysing)